MNIEGEDRPELKGAENINYNGSQYTTGLTYKSLFSSKGYLLFSIGKTMSNWNANAYEINNGVQNYFFERDNIESDIFIKGDLTYKYTPNIEFSFGFNSKYGQYNMLETLKPDTVYQQSNFEMLENISNLRIIEK